MNAVRPSEVIHNFSVVASRVAADEELTVTRYGKPVLKLVQLPGTALSDSGRAALVSKALSFRMTTPYGTVFARDDT